MTVVVPSTNVTPLPVCALTKVGATTAERIAMTITNADFPLDNLSTRDGEWGLVNTVVESEIVVDM